MNIENDDLIVRVFGEDGELDNPDEELNAWKKRKSEARNRMVRLQNLPYEAKVNRSRIRANEFYEQMLTRYKKAHVSVGGLDSITLHIFLKSIGINVPAISVSLLEDKSIQRVHKALGVTILTPSKTKVEVLNECGFPVISKRIAGKIELLQNPTERNTTVRHAIITGECGEQGHFQKDSRMKLPQKWLNLFGGYENEREGVMYYKPNFKVSNRCCYWLKEKPCDDWAKEHSSYPFLGLMASEGGQREEALTDHGCNYYGNTIPYEPVETIIPAIYGQIEDDGQGNLKTTGAQRTGCSMCGFGIHMEVRPHRFDRLRERNPKEWEFYMYKCCTDPETGEKFGWGRVLDYIGVPWEDIPAIQMSFEDFPEVLP